MPPRTGNILHIEDNLADIVLLERMFALSKINVVLHTARNGDEAIRRLRDELNPERGICLDLIFVDINLPGLNGLQVLDMIRTDLGMDTVPIIMLTTSRSEADVICSSDLGATSYMTKPSNSAELSQLVKNVAQSWLPRASMMAA